MAGIYSVTQINSYIKNMFRQDFVLNRISVKGEVSNCKYHTSGHIYFTLKDESGTMSAIMFASQSSHLQFQLQEGQKVVVEGRIDVYERDGRYQLYATKITLDGAGDLYVRFEQLKQELEEMGLFAQEYKRPIPKYAKTIGIVTASTGAAIQDIINISKRRNPYVQLILYPALVQGENAKYSIVKGIQALDRMKPDVMIVGRGGGSIEDLWAFNEEIVAKAIFNCETPVISAVGHETDFTIADFVSDMRAPTPSAAAELAVADINLVTERIISYTLNLNRAIKQQVDNKRSRLETYSIKLGYLNPVSQMNENRQRVLDYEDRLLNQIKYIVNEKRHQMAILAEKLNGLSPLAKLSQGYAYVENDKGNSVRSIKSVNIGDNLNIHLIDGNIETAVIKKTVANEKPER